MKRLISVVLSSCVFYLPAMNAWAGEVQVAVASNFSKPMIEIARLFEQETGHLAKLSFGSSGKFTAQIRYGAPFEVFLSADREKPRLLIADKLADPASLFTYAEGRLVLWSADADYIGTDAGILQRGNFRHLAIANPDLAPYGTAAEQVLKHLKLATKLQDRLVTGENISQTYQFVQTGSAELGFVAASQVIQQDKIPVGSAWLIPQAYHAPIRQDAVLLNKGLDNRVASELLRFLRSETVRTVLRAYGYAPAQQLVRTDNAASTAPLNHHLLNGD